MGKELHSVCNSLTGTSKYIPLYYAIDIMIMFDEFKLMRFQHCKHTEMIIRYEVHLNLRTKFLLNLVSKITFYSFTVSHKKNSVTQWSAWKSCLQYYFMLLSYRKSFAVYFNVIELQKIVCNKF